MSEKPEKNKLQLARETFTTRMHEAPLRAALILGLVGALVGYAFAPKGSQVQIYNGAPGTGAGSRDLWAPSTDPSITSTSKVDNLDAANEVLARGHFRITSPTGPTITSGAGAPAAAAPAGSVYYRTNGTQYTNTDGTGAGWTVVFQNGTFPGVLCGVGSAVSSIAQSGVGTCDLFVNAAGDHLSLSGSTLSLAQIATAKILGRTTAGTGNVEDLTATQVTAMLNLFTSTLQGLVPASGGGTTTFLRADGTWATPAGGGTVTSVSAGQSISVAGTTAVTVALNFPTTACGAGQAVVSRDSAGNPTCQAFFNAAGDHLSSSGSTVSLAPIATASFLGRTSAGPGNVETLNATQATALLNVFTTLLNGLVPASGGGTTTFLRADGNWAAPPGTGVTSVVAGQSISVSGTTTATVALNFPTTACSAGQAVTSSSSAGAPSCSTFFNTAGTGLSSSTNTVSLNIAPTTCGAGQAITAISAVGVGTCSSIASLTSPQWIFGNGTDGALVFNGITTPLAGATLSGSTYTMTRDVFCHGCTINALISVTGPYRFYDDATLTLNGNINRNGNAASGSTAGGALTGANLPPSFAGGAGGSSAGGAAGGGVGANPAPKAECTAGSAAASGNTGGTCQGGSGGAGAGGAGGAGGGITLAGTTGGDPRTWYQATIGRQATFAVYQFSSGGGGGRGDATNVKVGGGGGGSGGFMYVAVHAVTGSGDIESKGGNGADGQTAGNTGGGAGGSGGYVDVVIGSGSCPTIAITGGVHGAGQGTGGNGGDGGVGIKHCFGP